MIRNLHIGSSENRAGLFAVVGSDGSILDIGLEDADVSSSHQDGLVGALVGSVAGGRIERGWAASGRTRATGSGGIAGGLVGYLQGGETRESWFVGEVEAGIRSGGLAGVASGALVADSWGLVDVHSNEGDANNYAGGLIGLVSLGGAEPSTVSRVWAGGPVSGASDVSVGGLFGEVGGSNQVEGYWAIETSGVNSSAGGADVVSVQTAQTLSVAEWSDAVWSFGDDDDYPILRAHRPGRQEAAIADYLTRVYAQSDGAELVASGANFYDTSRDLLRIDSNGNAPDFGAGGETSVANCSSLRAIALNNGVTLEVRTMGGEVVSRRDQNRCEFGFSGSESANLTVLLNFSVTGISRRREYPILNFPLTVNWTEEIDGTIFALRDDDNDGALNAYDYRLFGDDEIDLSAGGGGESNRPFPIYNIWLLQAIDGILPSGVVSSGAATLFGATPTVRLGASYYLAADIDAAPARGWSHNDDGNDDGVMGFNPISGLFNGSFDGRGRVIRDLYIDGGTGLFDAVSGAISNLGLADVEVRSTVDAGALAASLNGGRIVDSWARGRVRSPDSARNFRTGGLIGSLNGLADVRRSWFVGSVAGGGNIGGLAGEIANGTAVDVWALADVRGGENAGGLIGGVGAGGTVSLAWAGGPVAGATVGGLFAEIDPNSDVTSNYWSTALSGISVSAGGDGAIGVLIMQTVLLTDVTVAGWSNDNWNFGDMDDFGVDDFPVLRSHRQGRQEFAIADFLTELRAFDRGLPQPLQAGGLHFLDSRDMPIEIVSGGMAADIFPAPSCNRTSLGPRANLNYNGLMAIFVDVRGENAMLCSDMGVFVATDEAVDFTLAVEFNIRGNSEVLRREYYIDNFAANIDWLAETDGTIFAYQDDDGDGLLNAYDYEPGTETAIGGGDLTAGADGSREEPWPIFNIWQLQAIGGLLPLAAENLMMSDNANTARNLYGVDRMGGHYYLVADIEAAPTREWMHRYTAADNSVSTVNAGFAPLVGEGALNGGMPLAGAFSGRLDGRGRMIRDLFIDAERLGVAGGLFWAVDGGEIVATGLENVYARGTESAGAFAASVAVARAEGLWARGEVVGAEGAVGGLFGVAEGGDIVDSWFAGEVYGAADAGGLIGIARAASAANVWTAAQVAGRGDVGGAFGRADSVTVRGAFAAGAVGGGRGARAGGFVGSAQGGVFDRAYFDIGSTGQAAATPAIGVASLQTLSAGDFPAGWNVGDYDEYPILAAQRADRQIASLRRGLTRIVADGKNPLAGGLMRSNPIDSRARFEIDHNALAANDGGRCVFGDGAVTASFADGATAVLSSADGGAFAAAGGCGARLAGDEAVDATLRLVVARGSATIATDYRIENYAAIIDWDATLRALADDDGDNLPNAYDRSPAAGVDLSGGARGGFFDPYPIFNVWDLQAIDGRTPPGITAPGATSIFGDSVAARLTTSSYYLASDIDAAPTRDWDYGGDMLGFEPIGNDTEPFDGHFDGRGRLLRGLYVDSPNERVGLFAVIGEDGSMANVELENADISSSSAGSNVYAGALAGGLNGEISNSAVIGRVHSDTNRVGGLVGIMVAADDYQGALRRSWFAGESIGDDRVGGLVAVMQGAMQDVWAIARVRGDASANARVGGLIGQMNQGDFRSPLPTLENSWSGGSVGASGGSFDSLAVVLEGDVVASYWSTETSGIDSSAVASAIGVKTAQTLSVTQWSDAIWDFGDSDLSAFDGFAHFPALRALDRARQQIGASFGLTRILAVGSDAATVVVVDRNEMQTIDGAASVLVLDVNGLADDESTSADETSAPFCEFENGAMEAQTNYGATVRLRAAAGATLSLYGAARRCRVAVEADAGAIVFLQAVFAAGEATMTADYAFTTGSALDPTALLADLFEINSPAVPTRVSAMAAMGAVVLTVDVFGDRPIEAVTDGDFLNDEGFTVQISLARPATAIFAVDGSQPGVTLTIDGIDNSGALVLFRSFPLAKDGAPTVVGVPFLSARAGMTAFADPGAQIFHSITGEVYSLQSDSDLFTVDRQSGAVSFVRDVGLQTAHEFTLFVTGDGLTASQSVRISVLTASEEDPYLYSDDSCASPSQSRCKGSGTAVDPYRIYTIEQLQLVAGNDLPAAAIAHLTADEAADLATRAAALFGSETDRLTAHYRLANDIDARATRIWNDDAGFAPIGSRLAPFSGSFDGDGKTIRGLYINRGDDIGLFAAASQANFVSVVLDEAEVRGGENIGALIGQSNASTVSAVSVRATVVATGEGAGGLIGHVLTDKRSRVANSSFTGAVSSSLQYTGGLVGDLEGGTVSNSWSAGEVRGDTDVGGLVGRLRDSVHSSRSSADVHASRNSNFNSFVGGLVGSMDPNARITDSGASGRVFSEGNNAGGLVGLMRGTNARIESSWATGAVSSSLQYTGGLVGSMGSNTSITDSNASGRVFSESDNTGGLVGLMGTDARIERSWSAGAVSSRGQSTGGLVGSAGERATVSQSWSSGVLQSTRSEVGGFVGRLSAPNALFDNNWSLTRIIEGSRVGGFVSAVTVNATVSNSWAGGVCERSCRGFYRSSPADSIQNGYWSIETSGNTNTANNPNAIGVETMRGVSITAWGADLWRFSDDGFPLLASVDGDLQAAGAALGLTRVLVARGRRDSISRCRRFRRSPRATAYCCSMPTAAPTTPPGFRAPARRFAILPTAWRARKPATTAPPCK